MALRSIEELRRDQAALLAAYRDRLGQSVSVGVSGPASSRPMLQWGRVTQVVSSDETYGPHLIVQAQTYTGSPPALADASAAPIRCYPAPGKVVAGYAVDDPVRLTTTAGAMIAEIIA